MIADGFEWLFLRMLGEVLIFDFRRMVGSPTATLLGRGLWTFASPLHPIPLG
jgi:hypothetical protein